jgi:transcriptional regulator with XRE-family HTH domain
MARRERELDPNASPIAAFAVMLRGLRHDSGLTLAELAEKTFYVRSTLSVAMSGDRLPTWDVVNKIVQACGVDEAGRRLWRANWEAAQGSRFPQQTNVPPDDPEAAHESRGRRWRAAGEQADADPRRATTMAELAQELDRLRQRSGMTWRKLAKLSEQRDGALKFPASTLHEAIILRQSPSLGVTLYIVRMCEGDGADFYAWGDQWDQLDRTSREQPASDRRTRRTPSASHERTAGPFALNNFLRLIEFAIGSTHTTTRLIILITVPVLALAIVSISAVLLLTEVFHVPAPYLGTTTAGLVGSALAGSTISRALRRRSAVRRARRDPEFSSPDN